MAIRFIVTDAGRAALTNDDNTGTGARQIAEIGLGRGQYQASDRTRTDLVDPIKRVDTIAGETVAPDIIHVTLQDETSDTYSVGEIGLFLDNGVFFAYFSQPDDWIIEKAAPATLLLATDIEIADIDVSSLTFGDAAFLNPPASETVQGVIEIATQDEVDAGTDRHRAIVPRTLKVFIDKVLAAYATVKQLTDHAASRDHPAANTNNQGMVELATSAETRDGADNTRAVTPAGNKVALDAHRTETGAHAADRISLGALATLGDPKTVQAAFAALGSAALKDEAYFRSASNLNAGTVPKARLSGSYDINVSGSAGDASKVGGQPLSALVRNNVDAMQSLGGPLTVSTGGHFDDGNDYGIRVMAFEPSLLLFDKSTNSGMGALFYNGGGMAIKIDADGGNADDVSGCVTAFEFKETYCRAFKSLGVGGAIPGNDFENGGAIALVDNDSGIRGVGDGQVEIWANNERQLVATKSTIRIDNQLAVSNVLTADAAGGVRLVSGLEMTNHDITGVNKIVINDDGFGEGFMLPNWEFSESGGSAWVRDSKNSHIVMEFAPNHVRIVDGLAVGTGVDTSKSFWNGTGIALGDTDSGIRGSGDGQIEIWANNDRQAYFTSDLAVIYPELVVASGRLRLGSGGSTNWDGIVYDEGANTLAFYADQEPGKDTPRVLLGPGWVEAGGDRLLKERDYDATKITNGGARLSVSSSGNVDYHDGSDYRFRIRPDGRIDRADGGIDAGLLNQSLGGVGTYAFFMADGSPGDGSVSPGDTFSGSNLRYAGADAATNQRPSGTWRLMGYIHDADNDGNNSISLFLRIS
ncbi:hypothetical protein [Salinicola socius]|uniref:Bacteriophage T7 Gp17 C-terminal domain-containing protein n=1 Tax=Salinicola socius TaxID=404433 RepID=A0A1Q8SUN3_9GAMM|nr:hypothetical protein [Salinicola socius]OLO05107.1 hypothetical protein BTW07_05700 [Salinicola socius]